MLTSIARRRVCLLRAIQNVWRAHRLTPAISIKSLIVSHETFQHSLGRNKTTMKQQPTRTRHSTPALDVMPSSIQCQTKNYALCCCCTHFYLLFENVTAQGSRECFMDAFDRRLTSICTILVMPTEIRASSAGAVHTVEITTNQMPPKEIQKKREENQSKRTECAMKLVGEIVEKCQSPWTYLISTY